jgi:hypothetical protein
MSKVGAGKNNLFDNLRDSQCDIDTHCAYDAEAAYNHRQRRSKRRIDILSPSVLLTLNSSSGSCAFESGSELNFALKTPKLHWSGFSSLLTHRPSSAIKILRLPLLS